MCDIFFATRNALLCYIGSLLYSRINHCSFSEKAHGVQMITAATVLRSALLIPPCELKHKISELFLAII